MFIFILPMPISSLNLNNDAYMKWGIYIRVFGDNNTLIIPFLKICKYRRTIRGN